MPRRFRYVALPSRQFATIFHYGLHRRVILTHFVSVNRNATAQYCDFFIAGFQSVVPTMHVKAVSGNNILSSKPLMYK